jgi:hypothetical protein
MSATLTTTALVVVVAAAVRSTWSPCGWSMLSTITPLTERGRGHRFAATAAWFVLGSVAGGALLGSLGALAALAVRGTGLGPDSRLWLAAIATLVATGFDARVFRPALPHQRRQVDEAWLDEFRPWVYGTGFGAQIGAGLVTYVMSAGVYLVVVLGALGAAPITALLLGTAFGLVRGAAVLLGARNTTPERLAAFHRRFAAVEDPVRAAVVGVLAIAGVALATAAGGLPGAIAGVVAGGAIAALARQRWPRGEMVTPASASLSTPTSADRRASEPITA